MRAQAGGVHVDPRKCIRGSGGENPSASELSIIDAGVKVKKIY